MFHSRGGPPNAPRPQRGFGPGLQPLAGLLTPPHALLPPSSSASSSAPLSPRRPPAKGPPARAPSRPVRPHRGGHRQSAGLAAPSGLPGSRRLPTRKGPGRTLSTPSPAVAARCCHSSPSGRWRPAPWGTPRAGPSRTTTTHAARAGGPPRARGWGDRLWGSLATRALLSPRGLALVARRPAGRQERRGRGCGTGDRRVAWWQPPRRVWREALLQA
jgi:hypothetical protein